MKSIPTYCTLSLILAGATSAFAQTGVDKPRDHVKPNDSVESDRAKLAPDASAKSTDKSASDQEALDHQASSEKNPNEKNSDEKPATEATSTNSEATAEAAPVPTPRDEASLMVVNNDESRKAALSVANTLDGPTGLLRVMSADSAEKGTFRVSATGTFYSGSGFLCPRCNTVDGVELTGKDSVGYSATRLQASITPLDFLEAFGSMRFRSVSNDHGSPHVIQISGDTILGAKAFMPYQPGRIFTFGGGLELSLIAKNRTIGPAVANVDLLTAGTLDFRELPAEKRFPLRLHGNIGYRIDHTGSIADDIESARGAKADAAQAASSDPNWTSPIARKITRIERFGFGVNRTDAIRFGLGAEWIFAHARPFVEWSMEASANRQGYKCSTKNTSLGDVCLNNAREFSALPSRLTLGVRGYPWKASWAEGVMVLAAVDVGTGATSRFVEETMPELPWAVSIGLGYAGGAKPRVEFKRVVEERTVEVGPPLPPELFVAGKVTEHDSPAPIAGVAVQLKGSDKNALLSNDAGKFRTVELAPGKYVFALNKEGYVAGECEATVEALADKDKPAATSGERLLVPTEVSCSMTRLPSVAAVIGVLRDAETTQFVAHASVTVYDQKGRKAALETDEYGGFRFEKVPAGLIKIQVSGEGYLPSGTELELKARENASVQLTMHKRPKLANVTVTKNELKLKRQVHFLHDSSEILPDSMGIVEEIAEALRAHPEIAQIEIQGHTDDSGSVDHNQTLSGKRATAVRDSLVRIGIEPSRLMARGYGQDKPLVPNKTDANRAKNRRVQLMIVGQ